jgi:hypothetical protein
MQSGIQVAHLLAEVVCLFARKTELEKKLAKFRSVSKDGELKSR